MNRELSPSDNGNRDGRGQGQGHSRGRAYLSKRERGSDLPVRSTRDSELDFPEPKVQELRKRARSTGV
jgi:hypothetical protein